MLALAPFLSALYPCLVKCHIITPYCVLTWFFRTKYSHWRRAETRCSDASCSQPELNISPQQLSELKDAFDLFDVDNSGFIRPFPTPWQYVHFPFYYLVYFIQLYWIAKTHAAYPLLVAYSDMWSSILKGSIDADELGLYEGPGFDPFEGGSEKDDRRNRQGWLRINRLQGVYDTYVRQSGKLSLIHYPSFVAFAVQIMYYTKWTLHTIPNGQICMCILE